MRHCIPPPRFVSPHNGFHYWRARCGWLGLARPSLLSCTTALTRAQQRSPVPTLPLKGILLLEVGCFKFTLATKDNLVTLLFPLLTSFFDIFRPFFSKKNNKRFLEKSKKTPAMTLSKASPPPWSGHFGAPWYLVGWPL